MPTVGKILVIWGALLPLLAGLRPLQVWVPDLRDPVILERIHHDVAILASRPRDEDAEAFLDASRADIEGWSA